MITTTLIGSNNNCNNNDNSDDIDNYNPSNIFARRDWSKRITCPNTPPPQLKLVDIRKHHPRDNSPTL